MIAKFLNPHSRTRRHTCSRRIHHFSSYYSKLFKDFTGTHDTFLVVFILNEITLIKLKLTFILHIHAGLVCVDTYAGWGKPC